MTNPNTRNRNALLAALAALSLLFTACGSVNEVIDTAGPIDETIDDGGEPALIDMELLTSGSWTLQFGGGPDGDITLVDGYPITITFDNDGTVRSRAACNTLLSGYEIDGTTVSFFGGSITEAGCEGEGIHEAEQAFRSAFNDVNGINVAPGELALSGPATELIFIPTNQPQDSTADEVIDAPDEIEDATEEQLEEDG